MYFFFRRPKIEIVAYCRESHLLAFEHAPISPARENLPSWWKDVESSKFNWDTFLPATTVKACPGIINSLTQGFILPLWCELAIALKGMEWKYRFSDARSVLDMHDGNAQAPGFYKGHHIFKITSPWILKSPVSLQYSPPFYYHTDPPPYTVPYGVISPLNGFCPTNIFLMIKHPGENEESRIFIKNKTPLLNILPITEKEVVIKKVIMDEKEGRRIDGKYGNGTYFSLKGLRTIFHSKNKK